MPSTIYLYLFLINHDGKRHYDNLDLLNAKEQDGTLYDHSYNIFLGVKLWDKRREIAEAVLANVFIKQQELTDAMLEELDEEFSILFDISQKLLHSLSEVIDYICAKYGIRVQFS